MESKISEARKALEDAELRMQSAADAIELAEEGADVAALEAEFDTSLQQVEARKASVERYEKVAEARKAAPALVSDARVVREEPTYRPDAPDGRSFFKDLAFRDKDADAAARMMRHEAEFRTPPVVVSSRRPTWPTCTCRSLVLAVRSRMSCRATRCRTPAWS